MLHTPLKSTIFITLAWGIVFGLAQHKKLDKLFFKELPDNRDYFYALISNKKNKNDISRKLKKLPGIDLIKTVSSDTIEQELVQVLRHSHLEEYMENAFEQLDHQGLKVIFSSNIKRHSQNLIRDYLVRLTGKENLTLGPIQKKASDVLKGKNPFVLFKKYGLSFLIGVGVLFWILLGTSYIRSFRDSAYVIENFQRRKGVSFKVVLSGMTLLFLTGLASALMMGKVDKGGVLMASLPFLFITFLYAKTGEWEH